MRGLIRRSNFMRSKFNFSWGRIFSHFSNFLTLSRKWDFRLYLCISHFDVQFFSISTFWISIPPHPLQLSVTFRFFFNTFFEKQLIHHYLNPVQMNTDYAQLISNLFFRRVSPKASRSYFCLSFNFLWSARHSGLQWRGDLF